MKFSLWQLTDKIELTFFKNMVVQEQCRRNCSIKHVLTQWQRGIFFFFFLSYTIICSCHIENNTLLRKSTLPNIVSHENHKQTLQKQRSWVWKIMITQQEAMCMQYTRQNYTLVRIYVRHQNEIWKKNISSAISTQQISDRNSESK